MQIIQLIICIISFFILGMTIGYRLGYNNGRLKKLSKNKRKSHRIVRRDNSFAEQLVELSKDKNSFMREILASDSRTPDEVLIGLSKDEDTLVRIKAKRELARRGK